MNIDQTQKHPIHWPGEHTGWTVFRWLIYLRRHFWTSLVLAILLAGVGGSAPTAETTRNRAIAMTVAGRGFDLVRWEVDSLTEKAVALFTQPGRGISPGEAPAVVRAYAANAHRVGRLEEELNRVFSRTDGSPAPETRQLQQELSALRTAQASARPAVEQIIQAQVAAELAAAGLHLGQGPFPPVLFAFTEPPRKLIVSPRDRIATVYSQMLDANMGLDQVEASEQAIYRDQGLSAYITGIGGLGAYPSMVVDRASLPWIISTVAHEWVHNYLSFFPLGWMYSAGDELTTINETVADIVGDEIGARVLRRYYPELVPSPAPDGQVQPDEGRGTDEPPPFDFRAEMRQTRLEVDRLLAAGKVDEAEAYMEARRRYFVENGYYLRVLNQAYFAFHGSYGTGAASTSPIGPALQRLRATVPNVAAFLHTVRWFTSAQDLDEALAENPLRSPGTWPAGGRG